MSEQLRVLVADDEPLIRALVAIAFEAEGYDVDMAANAIPQPSKLLLNTAHLRTGCGFGVRG